MQQSPLGLCRISLCTFCKNGVLFYADNPKKSSIYVVQICMLGLRLDKQRGCSKNVSKPRSETSIKPYVIKPCVIKHVLSLYIVFYTSVLKFKPQERGM